MSLPRPPRILRLPTLSPVCSRCHWNINLESESVNRLSIKSSSGRPRPSLLNVDLCDECTDDLIAVAFGCGVRSFAELNAEEGERIRALGY